MKFSKMVASLCLLLLGGIAINASAQTAACTWKSVYGYSSGGNYYYSHICQIPGGTTVASRQDTYNGSYGYYSCGTPSVASGYQNTGIKQGTQYPAMCNDIIVATNPPQTSSSSSSTAACYTGEFKIIQTAPVYTPFDPTFCGPQPQCKYSVTVLDPFQQYPRLKYTCL